MITTLNTFPTMRLFSLGSLAVLSLWLLAGCMGQQGGDSVGASRGGASSSSEVSEGSGNEYVTVDCLLPGQLRRLGTNVTFVTARQPARVTAQDCAVRGGEYTISDRGNYQTSLKLWLDAAQDGDAKAQYYVGTIYEKGPKGKPDYSLAAVWYQKAAEQGHRQAATNLGRLYETGSGVTKNAAMASSWYAKASGMDSTDLSMLMNEEAKSRIRELEKTLSAKELEIRELHNHIQEITQELTGLRHQLRQRSSDAQAERKKLLDLQARHDGIKQQAKSQQAPTQKQMDKELEAVRVELQKQQTVVSKRDQEVLKLNQQIASLEKEATQQAQALEKGPAMDLGFEGPTIEIIDPPLAATRGIKVVAGPQSIPVPVGMARQISGRVVAPAGLRIVTMNGRAVQVDELGVFTLDFPPLRGAQDDLLIQILAVDIQNKRAAKKIKLVAGKTLVTVPQVSDGDMAVFGNYYALVIGNDRYQHWSPLDNAVSDAQAVAEILEDRYDFKVTFLKNATRLDILKGLNKFRKSLNENDNLLVYYAGHGHLEKDIDRGYWIPIDAEVDDTSQWILTPSITDLLELMSAKHVLVVADSCFAGKMTRSSLAKLRPGLSDEARMDMLKVVAKKRVRTALTSGGEQPVLDVGQGGHSVFTGALLNVLAENQTILETERLFLAVRTRVVQASGRYDMEQIPTYWPIQFAGHESLGDFIFIPQKS